MIRDLCYVAVALSYIWLAGVGFNAVVKWTEDGRRYMAKRRAKKVKDSGYIPQEGHLNLAYPWTSWVPRYKLTEEERAQLMYPIDVAEFRDRTVFVLCKMVYSDGVIVGYGYDTTAKNVCTIELTPREP